MTKEIFDGRIIRLTLEPSTDPGGHEEQMEIVHHPGGAAIVLLDQRKRICLLNQYRHAFRRMIWELPAGKLDNHEDPAECVRREAREEAGVVVGDLHKLGHILSSPGIFTEVVHLFYCADIRALEENAPEPGECLEIHWIDWTQALEWCHDGTIEDAKSQVAIFKAQPLVES
jgi:ADP-ribose pyrophosphatase